MAPQRECGMPVCSENKMVTQTSLLAYISLLDRLGPMQKRVYEAINRRGGGTDTEIMVFMGYRDSNKVRPRRRELVKMGLVCENGVVECSETGKMASEWVIV